MDNTETEIAELIQDHGPVFQSFQDLGYQFAGHVDKEQNYAAYLVEHVEDLNKVPESVVTDIKAGAILRYAELHPGDRKSVV